MHLRAFALVYQQQRPYHKEYHVPIFQTTKKESSDNETSVDTNSASNTDVAGNETNASVNTINSDSSFGSDNENKKLLRKWLRHRKRHERLYIYGIWEQAHTFSTGDETNPKVTRPPDPKLHGLLTQSYTASWPKVTRPPDPKLHGLLTQSYTASWPKVTRPPDPKLHGLLTQSYTLSQLTPDDSPVTLITISTWVDLLWENILTRVEVISLTNANKPKRWL